MSNFHAPDKSPAHVELLSEDTLRITVRRRFDMPMFVGRGAWGWKAGQHMFLAFPTIGPMESHPFTIASVCEPMDDTLRATEGEEGGTKSEGRLREMVWIVRTRDGFTARLRDQTIDKGGVRDIPVFLDGPYGAPPDITPFETCVFIAGEFIIFVNKMSHSSDCRI